MNYDFERRLERHNKAAFEGSRCAVFPRLTPGKSEFVGCGTSRPPHGWTAIVRGHPTALRAVAIAKHFAPLMFSALSMWGISSSRRV